LTPSTIGDVEDAIQEKQNSTQDDDLSIARTAELQTALEGKQNTVQDGDLTIARTAGLQTALERKQKILFTMMIWLLRERQDYRQD